MKIIQQIPVYLLALVFLFFGSNFFLHFWPMPPSAGNAATFGGLLFTTGYMTFVKVLQISFAILLLIPKTRALALLLLAPICVNILLFEIFMVGQVGLGALLVVLNAFAIFQHREKYWGILRTS